MSSFAVDFKNGLQFCSYTEEPSCILCVSLDSSTLVLYLASLLLLSLHLFFTVSILLDWTSELSRNHQCCYSIQVCRMSDKLGNSLKERINETLGENHENSGKTVTKNCFLDNTSLPNHERDTFSGFSLFKFSWFLELLLDLQGLPKRPTFHRFLNCWVFLFFLGVLDAYFSPSDTVWASRSLNQHISALQVH